MSPRNPSIDHACEVLRGGGLVAFPTETVYGLGADARQREAVLRVFRVKGRPATNPLIVHVADEVAARRWAREWPRAASLLAEAFWPGPLTLVVPRASEIVPEACAGGDTVGLRVPAHPLAIELLRAFDGPMVGPSANRSNRISPTSAADVRQELGPDVDEVLDGGPCHVGIESTVVSVCGDVPVVLRPGMILPSQIAEVVGDVAMGRGAGEGQAQPSPGLSSVHYAPQTACFRFEPRELGDWAQRLAANPNRCSLLAMQNVALPAGVEVVALGSSPDVWARSLYGSLRRLDAMGLDAIYICMPPDEPAWVAVRDRLMRAARPMPRA